MIDANKADIRAQLEECNRDLAADGEPQVTITDKLVDEIVETIEYCCMDTAYDCLWEHVADELRKCT